MQAKDQPTPTNNIAYQKSTAATSALNITKAISNKKLNPKIPLKSNCSVNLYIIWYIWHMCFVKASTH